MTNLCYNKLREIYDSYCSKNLKLDMSRGKPCPEQLDLSMDMLKIADYMDDSGNDCRNYGTLLGIPEARRFFAELFGNKYGEVMVSGNSSLNLMYSILETAVRCGFHDSEKPLGECKERKFLCPCPGYDRHFRVSEYLGFELIPIRMLPTGSDMDEVERIIATDESVKGIWCVPVYSNPDGYVYSEETVVRFAKLKPLAKDFKIFWDNAYMIHSFDGENAEIPNLLEECKRYGNANMPFMFTSMSKVTFAGAGISAFAASEANIKWLSENLFNTMICFDKMNQLRHVRFLKDVPSLKLHMKKHAEIIKPKFDTVLRIFDQELSECGDLIHWTKPTGGYFLSLYMRPGCAKKVVELCKKAGVVLTSAGAAYPYGVDPNDSNIRIAPTYVSIEDLEVAMKVLCVCVKMVIY